LRRIILNQCDRSKKKHGVARRLGNREMREVARSHVKSTTGQTPRVGKSQKEPHAPSISRAVLARPDAKHDVLIRQDTRHGVHWREP
jgi:hypothetical protein